MRSTDLQEVAEAVPLPSEKTDAEVDALTAALAARRASFTAIEARCFDLYKAGGVSLPPVPHVATLLIPLLSRPNTPIAACVDLIEMDPALAAAMLACANSAAYYRGQQISNVRDAVLRIGTQQAMSLALGLSTKSLYDKKITKALDFVGKEWEEEWRRSVVIAQSARSASEVLKRGEGEFAYSAGLFQNVGFSLATFVLATHAFENDEVTQLSLAQRRAIVAKMRGVLTAEYLLRENLPPKLALICLETSDPGSVPSDPYQDTTQVILLAIGLVAALYPNESLRAIHFERAFEAARLLGINRSTLDRIKDRVRAAKMSVEELESNFGDRHHQPATNKHLPPAPKRAEAAGD